MIVITKDYNEYLKEMNKNEIGNIVKEYHTLCDIFGYEKNDTILKKKKEEIIKYLEDSKEQYLKLEILCLDRFDFAIVKQMLTTPKKINDAYLVEHREVVNHLIEKRIIFQKENIELPIDFLKIIKAIITDKEIIKYNKKQNSFYMISEGIITAYGVISIEKFLEIINGLDEKALDKLKNYYKKDFKIEEKQVVSIKLTNKKRIEKYYKNQKLKEFTKKELESLGELNYHHNIKSYKKLIKMLKNNYVFKNSDIMYVDKVIVIPYLYNSLNEEDKANKELEETITKLFEFKADKLKQKMLEEIKEIRNYFPIWEYRGYSKNEVK